MDFDKSIPPQQDLNPLETVAPPRQDAQGTVPIVIDSKQRGHPIDNTHPKVLIRKALALNSGGRQPLTDDVG